VVRALRVSPRRGVLLLVVGPVLAVRAVVLVVRPELLR